MARFVVQRLGSMLFVLFAISVMTFAIFNVIPGGDPAERMAGRHATEPQIERIREEWGFDRPLPTQYLVAMQKVVSGDLVFYFSGLDVEDEIAKGLPRTLCLALGAGLIWMLFASGLGLFCAIRAGGIADRTIGLLAFAGLSMPVFWIGALMNHYLGFKLHWFPNGGYVPLTESPSQWLWHMVLPWTALSIVFIGVYSRILRANILDTVNQDFVLTARAKGLSERQVLIRHVLRNSITPIVTLWGLDFGAIIGGGAILTESVFNLQGIGQYTADAVGQLDLPPLMAVTMLGASLIVVLNAIVDILHALLDPRVKLSGREAS